MFPLSYLKFIMVQVRALKTTAGEYGKLRYGSIAMLRKSVAERLADKGIVEIISEDDGKEPDPDVIRGGVRIKDTTGKMFTTAEGKSKKEDVVIKIEEPTPPEPQPILKSDPVIETATGEPPVLTEEKAEDDKPEQAETKKSEQKETPKKTYK